MSCPGLPLFLMALLSISHRGLAAPVGSIDAPRAHLGQATLVSVGLRSGPSFVLGGQGAAWGPALGLGMLVDVPFGEETGLSVDFDHALHSMKEVQPLLEGFPLPFEADDVSGTQRYLSLDVGVRLGMLFIDETRIKPNQVTALPWFRMGLGLCFTDTILDFPSLEGVRTLRSRVPMVTFNPGFGVSIHVLRQLTIQPVIKSALLVGLDHNEPKNNDVLRLEWQLKPTLDLLYNF